MLNRAKADVLIKETALLLHDSNMDARTVGKCLLDNFKEIHHEVHQELCHIVIQDSAYYVGKTLQKLTDLYEFDYSVHEPDLVKSLNSYYEGKLDRGSIKPGSRYEMLESHCQRFADGEVMGLMHDPAWEEIVNTNFDSTIDREFLTGQLSGFTETKMYAVFEINGSSHLITLRASNISSVDAIQSTTSELERQLCSKYETRVQIKALSRCKDEIVGAFHEEPSDVVDQVVHLQPAQTDLCQLNKP